MWAGRGSHSWAGHGSLPWAGHGIHSWHGHGSHSGHMDGSHLQSLRALQSASVRPCCRLRIVDGNRCQQDCAMIVLLNKSPHAVSLSIFSLCMFILQNVIGQLSSCSACVGVSVFFVCQRLVFFFRHAQTIFNDDQARVFSKQVATMFSYGGLLDDWCKQCPWTL